MCYFLQVEQRIAEADYFAVMKTAFNYFSFEIIMKLFNIVGISYEKNSVCTHNAILPHISFSISHNFQ